MEVDSINYKRLTVFFVILSIIWCFFFLSFNKLSEIRRSLDMKMNSNGMFTVYDVIYGKKILSQTKPIVVKGFFSLVKDSVSKSSDVEQNDVPETARSSSAQPTVTEELAISSRLIEKTHESRLRKKVFGLFLSKNDAKFSVDGIKFLK